MDSNFSSSPDKKGSGREQSQSTATLMLHNDDVNTFEFVMESLEELCDHSLLQAEQCAMITHYKGKCEIKTGNPDDLKIVQRELISRGLIVTME